MDFCRFRDPIIQPVTALVQAAVAILISIRCSKKNIAFSSSVPALLRAVVVLH
jgi:hypothetical protein